MGHTTKKGANNGCTSREVNLFLIKRLVNQHIYIYIYNFFFNLSYSRWTSSLPSCLWSQRIFPSLPGSRLTTFYRDASSALLQLVNQWLNFTSSRSHAFRCFPLRKKEHKSYFGKNRTHDFHTSRCAGYLLDKSGDESVRLKP